MPELARQEKEKEKLATKGFKPRDNNCVLCGTQMKETGTSRELRTLEGHYRVNIRTYSCEQENCSMHGEKIKPEDYLSLIYPYSSYGIDVYGYIGRLRLKEKKSVPEIHADLSENYKHLKITERSVENIVKRFMICLEQGSENIPYLRGQLAKASVTDLVLTIDGIAPERGNAILYVVRELKSGQPLCARYIEHSDKAHIKAELFEPLKELCAQLPYEIAGFITDKEGALVEGIREVFGDAPVQHCQSHFIKAVRKPLQKEDSEMGKAIKKNSGV